MRLFRSFAMSILCVEASAVAGLWTAGAILSCVEIKGHGGSFFLYRIQHLDYLPAWFAATLLLAVINGVWVFRLADLGGSVYSPRIGGTGEWGFSVPVNPLRLFAINLIAVPAIVGIFVVVRANYW